MPPIQSRSLVLVVLSWQFCPDDLFLPVLFCLSILLFLFCLFNSACPVPESYSARPVLRHSFCRSRGSAFSVLPSCTAYPVLLCIYILSSSACPVVDVLFCLSCSAFPFWLPFSSCHFLPYPFCKKKTTEHNLLRFVKLHWQCVR